MSKYLVLFIFSFLSYKVTGLSPDSTLIKAFISRYSQHNGLSKTQTEIQLKKAAFIPEIIEKISKPAEKMTWDRYKSLFLKEDRIQAGIEFWEKYKNELSEIEAHFGVDASVLVALVGVETFYGTRMGKYRVLDALFTLAFGYPKRSIYFTKELETFLNLVNQGKLDIELKGSYAGAFGLGQFMPTSFEAYSKSFKNNNGANIVSHIPDGLASVANYLHVHKWNYNKPIAQPAIIGLEQTNYTQQTVKPQKKLEHYESWGYFPSEYWNENELVSLVEFENTQGNEYWFVANNFYVITRYNHSPLYALAVFLLSEEIKKAVSN